MLHDGITFKGAGGLCFLLILGLCLTACGNGSQATGSSATTRAAVTEEGRQEEPEEAQAEELEQVPLPASLPFSPPHCPISLAQVSTLMGESMRVFGGMTGSSSCQFNAASGSDLLLLEWTEPSSPGELAEFLRSERGNARSSGVEVASAGLGPDSLESRGFNESGEVDVETYWVLQKRALTLIVMGSPEREARLIRAATYLSHALE